MKQKDLLLLLLLTLAGLLIHGYHPGSEDCETYLPGVLVLLHPGLFPVGAEYFKLHSHLTLFPNLIAASVRLSHLPLAWALFAWHLASIFLFLLACLSLMRRCFTDPRAQWCGVALITALLTLPIAGTALYILDQYVNPRNLIAFAVVFAIVKVLDRRYLQACLFLLFAACIHPFMSVFAASFCLLLVWMERRTAPMRAAALGVPVHLFDQPSDAYASMADNHRYQFLIRWHWYELLGALAPLAILYWFSILAGARRLRNLQILCRALIAYGAVYFIAGLIVSIPKRLIGISRLQPMRSFYVLYVLLFLFIGGFLGQFVLQGKSWRWLALFVPLCVGMYVPQRALFPQSAHVEWPWAAPRNPWAQAFRWIRDNTPTNAVFALDPEYMHILGEDSIGFRAVAQRSQLADGIKDGGVVELFPQIADQWLAQVHAQSGIDSFKIDDLRHLKAEYGVTWVVLRQPSGVALTCPYQNQTVKVCRLDNP